MTTCGECSPHALSDRPLMAVRVDLTISLDGFATTTDQTPESPFGEDWSRLVDAYVATRTFRERVLHDTSGEGTTGVDDAYAEAYFAEVGAEIMGAGMFGLHSFPDDPDCPATTSPLRRPRAAPST